MNKKLHQERVLAAQRWRAKNPAKARKSSYKSTAKIYLTKYATKKELQSCQNLIQQIKDSKSQVD